MRTTTHTTLSNIVRSLHVLLLALLGLAFYTAVVLLLAGLCFLVFSASVHAQAVESWTQVGSMSARQISRSTTLLQDGRVLVGSTTASGSTDMAALPPVLIDASFTIANPLGRPIRPDKRDQNQLVLEWDGRRWLFLSGM